MSQATLEDGAVYAYDYDSNHNLIKQTDPMGNTQRARYGAYQLLRQQTDALGRTTQYHYNGQQ